MRLDYMQNKYIKNFYHTKENLELRRKIKDSTSFNCPQVLQFLRYSSGKTKDIQTYNLWKQKMKFACQSKFLLYSLEGQENAGN